MPHPTGPTQLYSMPNNQKKPVENKDGNATAIENNPMEEIVQTLQQTTADPLPLAPG